ncbi:M20 family metallopeptidase [Candidatus Hodarchaeum mangrovi]
MSETIHILKNLIQINTENPPGFTKEALLWIENWANEKKITSEIQWFNESKGNIILTLGKGNRTILLTGHLDTVPIGDKTAWNVDPFEAKEINGNIYGRGSADMKGGIAACLSTMDNLNRKLNLDDFNYKLVFLGTSDEEVGLEGSKEALKKNLVENVDFIIVTEPTSLKIGIAEKGMLWVTIKAKGKAAHGSTPDKGINAIERLIELIPMIKNSVPADIDPILGLNTLNIGTISGGKSANIVPEYAEINCDFRFIPSFNPIEFIQDIQNIISHVNSQDKGHFTLKINQIMPTISTPKKNKYLELFLNHSNLKDIIGLNYATDLAVLCSVKGMNTIPFLIYGPGDPNAIHITNEKVPILEVLEVRNTLTKFLFDLNTKIRRI